MNDTDLCKICGTAKGEHEGFAHEFSADGQLKKVEPKKDEGQRVMVVVDSHLRKILVRKGILSAEDFLE